MSTTDGVIVVVQQGVYMQDVFGPFDNVEAARIAAQRLAMDDGDGYHTYDVERMGHDGIQPDQTLGSYRKCDHRFARILFRDAKAEMAAARLGES